MPVVKIEGTDPDKLDLVHRCQRCGHVMRNKTARDDDREQIFKTIR